MNMGPFIKKTIKMTAAVCALFTLNACHERIDLFQGQETKPGDNPFGEVPLDFDWSLSQDVELTLTTDVTTRVFIYEDADLTTHVLDDTRGRKAKDHQPHHTQLNRQALSCLSRQRRQYR